MHDFDKFFVDFLDLFTVVFGMFEIRLFCPIIGRLNVMQRNVYNLTENAE
jgi:hypothetical protein